MNPINVICETCGIDILIEPEVAEDETATCPTCKGNLFDDLMENSELYHKLEPDFQRLLQLFKSNTLI